MSAELLENIKEKLFLDHESAKQVVDRAETLSGSELETFLDGLLGLDSSEARRYIQSKTIERTGSSTEDEEVRSSNDPNNSNEPPAGASAFRYSKGVWEQQGQTKKQTKTSNKGKSTNGNSSKVKVDSLRDIDRALQQLELSQKDEKRRLCNCMATRHPLLEVAPNCLNCGKVICIKEGLGPCTFCGKPLMTAEQLSRINSILQMEKEGITASMGKKARQELDLGSSSSKRASKQTVDDANTRLDQLLQYQATAAERTKIIDQFSDFETPGYGINQWASPLEQAQQLKRQQRQLRKMEQQRLARSGRGKTIISIDLKGNKVVTQQQNNAIDDEILLSNEEEEQLPLVESNDIPKETKKAKGYWESSDYGKKFIKPQYSNNTKKKPLEGDNFSHHKSAKRVVQQNDDDDDDDEYRVLEL